MEFYLGLALGLALCIIVILIVKISLLTQSMREMAQGLAQKLQGQTNTLISVSSQDRAVRCLAASLNTQLRLLRQERWRFQQGDQRLKETITNISHDLRTPLTSIMGYLDLLRQEPLSEAGARYLSQITERTQSLKELTEELLQYSIVTSVQEEAPQDLDLRSVLEESLVSFYAIMKQEKIIPSIQLPENPVICRLAPGALQRIFSNIISNALKYSDRDLSVHMTSEGLIQFSNLALGLDPIAVGRLFDRFYTVHSGTTASGLGLSIARLLTTRMQGSIRADYQDSRLTITVQFPVKKAN